MSKFTPTKRGNPCEVCQNTSGKCRNTLVDFSSGNKCITAAIHLCMDFPDGCDGPDFKYLGTTKDGLWGKYIALQDLPNQEERTEEQRQRWRSEQEERKLERLRAEHKLHAQSLTEEQRDREIRKLLAQLGLNQANRQDLMRRGLSDELIKSGQFRSVEQWQKLEQEVSHRLAGIDITGRGMTNFNPGYLVPIWNPKGQIVGWQLRLDNADEGGKYRWPTSANKKRPDGPTSHLPNGDGELPITCCRPTGEAKTKGIGLIEGILKPYITAQLRSQIMLGAAGGNFASSPETLKACLEELGTPELTLYPDAGAIGNPHVMRQYRRTYNLLRSWGYNLRVGFWNQLTKEDLDVDELLAAGRGEEIEIITWAQFEAITRNPNQIPKEVTDLLKELKNRVDRAFKGFGKPPKEKTPKPLPKVIQYVPGSLPTPEEYQEMGSPTLQFSEGQRIDLTAELVSLGYHDIFDSSLTGGGKSWDSGLATPERLECDRIWLLAENHRNPSVKTVEANSRDLTVRNEGMFLDSSRKTAMGRDFIRYPKLGEEPTLKGNCIHAEDFHHLHQKGYRHQVEEGGLNPVCGNCNSKGSCGNIGALPGASYRIDRKEGLGSPLLRLSVDSAPSPEDISKSFSGTGAFWDESSRILKATQSIEVALTDFDRSLAQLESKLPEVHATLKSLRLALRPLLAGEIKTTQATFHGWTDSQIRELLGTPPEGLPEIINLLEKEAETTLLDALKQADSIDSSDWRNRKAAKGKAKDINRGLRDQTMLENSERLKQLVSNWLVPLLKVWAGIEQGAMRFKRGILSITTRDRRHAEIAKAMQFNVYLDTTGNRDYLAQYLDIPPGSIVQIEQTPADFSNLKIIQITGIGKGGKERSDTLQKRIEVLHTNLKQKRPDAALLDHKIYAEAHGGGFEAKGHWFNHNRATNEFECRSTLIATGVPYEDIGALQSEYISLTGDRDVSRDSPGFSAFVDWKVQSEIAQTPGRLRAHRRPKEQLTCYLINDLDLEFLKQYYPGATLEKVDIGVVCPETADPAKKSFESIKRCLEDWWQKHGKFPTQQEVSS